MSTQCVPCGGADKQPCCPGPNPPCTSGLACENNYCTPAAPAPPAPAGGFSTLDVVIASAAGVVALALLIYLVRAS